ncbi:UDP-4-amino-4,6-dideoxy-N-acetyl-beta-L-altrosamine N-acetyltransferase [Caulobacter ginsengisoli]|uniref:UDP-4-amino-4, 6-dideoxy-N-acetyl-beta-L-altrosamine N-acetyltransferase n=1 Tax=Caulobacter ginsengisoli TaxID=400775 RepID=A0ABU0IPI9_9CAUL|nr:UDP-4-amino-4,6-dideoxy-N-acetyl-beta-L-altrosamine N-acetyltransferase [Caulobacter ginsengisoli]MDQ0463926.1 UDP-4-amino-4,6-dideoxy-N-acetyl-beta-L-altrosamine N-acetyltransferase [Caulobacter ginsengisoli]
MIELRDLVAEDEARLFEWRAEPEVDRWMSDAAFPDRAAHRRWFDALGDDADVRGWMIQRDGRPSGLLTLSGLTSHHRRAEWNWFVGDAEARGRGVGRAAQVLGLERAFGTLGLHKVWAEVMADNDAALKMLGATGFRREGYLRGHVMKAGAAKDVVLLGILADEWAARRGVMLKELHSAGLIAA